MEELGGGGGLLTCREGGLQSYMWSKDDSEGECRVLLFFCDCVRYCVAPRSRLALVGFGGGGRRLWRRGGEGEGGWAVVSNSAELPRFDGALAVQVGILFSCYTLLYVPHTAERNGRRFLCFVPPPPPECTRYGILK